MLVNFPDPYPDELLYSVCARYYDRVQYPNKKSLLQELFSNTCAATVVDFPSHIDHLNHVFQSSYHRSVNTIIEGNTFFLFFSPFLPFGRAEQLQNDMQGSGGMAIHKRAGIMASRIPLPDRFRFCPVCSEKDEEQFGEFYWHRLHQIPGVNVCTLHTVFLENSEAPTRHFRKHYEFIPANSAIRICTARSLNMLDSTHRTLLKIARNAAWLLEQRNLTSSLEALHNRYLSLLIHQKFASFSGGIYASKLLSSFRKHYSPDLLSSLHCSLVEKDGEKDNWLLRLARNKKNAQHPLRHLLLMDFLGCTAEEFFNLPEKIKFFGDPPWPCLNPAADHYRHLTITDCKVGFRGKDHRPAGTFGCYCGFIYTRTGPDASPEDRFQISKMKTFGPEWENALRDRWTDQSLSLNGIARLQRVDPLTIRRHATRLGLPSDRQGINRTQVNPRSNSEPKDASVNKDRKRDSHREKWLSAMQVNLGIEMKEMRKLLPRVYVWLLENDREWLKAHRPMSSNRTKPNSSSVDWESRDSEISIQVRSTALKIKNAPGRPKRVTVSAIGKEIGLSGLLKQKIDKLPLTAEALASLVESHEQFATRRVWWAANCYQREGVVPKQWQLMNRACVYKYAEVLEVKEAVDAALQSLNAKTILCLAG